MSGAWEDNSRVLCAILHTDLTSIPWAFGFRSLIIPGNALPLSGMPFDHARNAACMVALDYRFTHVFMFDSDVIPPPDTILRLLKHKKPVISGVYFRRSPPEGKPVMLKGGSWYVDFPKNSVFEVDVVGAGCLLIETELLRKCPPQAPGKHWFNWKVDRKGIDPEPISEDFSFNLHVKRTMGIPTLIDSSVLCKHVGLGEATENSFKPALVGIQ